MPTLLLWILMLVGLSPQGGDAWAPVAQATWPADTSEPFVVRLVPAGQPVRLEGAFSATVSITTVNGTGLDPLIGSGRGLFMQVTDRSGREVRGQTVLSIPPPSPPVPLTALKSPSGGKPLTVNYSEHASALFPGPGRYTVQAVLTVVDIRSSRYLRAYSQKVEVDVL